MKEAIQKAIEGGYKATTTWKNTFTHDVEERANTASVILLDSLFWQALGRALGWPKKAEPKESKGSIVNLLFETHWRYQWHLFIDHLASGESTEEFFTTLLTQTK